jgi:hypothetical protein
MIPRGDHFAVENSSYRKQRVHRRDGSSSGAIPARGRRPLGKPVAVPQHFPAISRPDGAIHQGTVGDADGRGTGLGAKAEVVGRVTGLGAEAEAGRGEGGKGPKFV